MTLQKRKPAARVPRMLGYALAAAVVAAVLAGCTSAGTPQTPATIETPAGIEAAPAVEAPETETPAVEDPAVEVPETDSASGNRPTPAGANRPDTSRTTTPAPGEESGCMPVESYEGKAEPDLQLATDPETAGVLRQMAECLSDVELMHLMVLPGLQAEAEMAEEDADCLAHSSSGRMFRRTLESSAAGPKLYEETFFTAMAGLALNAEQCVNQETMEELRIRGTELKRLKCIVSTPGEAEELLERILEEGPGVLDAVIDEVAPCLRTMPPEPLIEPLPDCTQEEIDAGMPCMIQN